RCRARGQSAGRDPAQHRFPPAARLTLRTAACLNRVPDAVRHSSCRSAEPGPYQAPAFVTAPALQRTAPRRATRCAASGARWLDSPVQHCLEIRPRALRFEPRGLRGFAEAEIAVDQAEAI